MLNPDMLDIDVRTRSFIRRFYLDAMEDLIADYELGYLWRMLHAIPNYGHATYEAIVKAIESLEQED